MKKKLLLSLLVIVSLFAITGCGEKNNNESNPLTNNDYGNADNNNQNSNNTVSNSDNQNKGNYWYIGKTLTNPGGSWGAVKIKLTSTNSNGCPTTIIVTDSGKSLDGEDLNGTFNITVRECDEEFLMGNFSEARSTIKGEFCDSSGKCLTIDIA